MYSYELIICISRYWAIFYGVKLGISQVNSLNTIFDSMIMKLLTMIWYKLYNYGNNTDTIVSPILYTE